MKFSALGKTFELSRSDYEVWMRQWDVSRIETRGAREILDGRCCFCEVFHMERKNFHSTCTECPLAIFEITGNHRVEGCVVLLESILGPKGDCSAATWGLIFFKPFTVVLGQRGRETCNRIRSAIRKSIIEENDSEKIEDNFKAIR